mmetsp:Transcript_42991/g.64826  ORF Transcript_42991/g.64826 Transcript_42991/m.64826 type:complete len:247 (-) Transcript_42991:154-894(-)
MNAFPFLAASSVEDRSLTAACMTSNTARHPSIAASITRSNIFTFNRLSHCANTTVPRCGIIAHGRYTALSPPIPIVSNLFKSIISAPLPPSPSLPPRLKPGANPAEQAQTISFIGTPASISASVTALIQAHNLPPSSASTMTLISILHLGCKCNNIDASIARLIRLDCSNNRRSVFGLMYLRSELDGANGAWRTVTSNIARSGNSSERRIHSIGPRTDANATVKPICTKALPETCLLPPPPDIGLI